MSKTSQAKLSLYRLGFKDGYGEKTKRRYKKKVEQGAYNRGYKYGIRLKRHQEETQLEDGFVDL